MNLTLRECFYILYIGLSYEEIFSVYQIIIEYDVYM